MEPWARRLRGRLDELTISSDALRGNPLGDPYVRPLWVYVPPAAWQARLPLPAIYVLQGYTGQLDMWRNRVAFRPTAIELVDELFAEGRAPPCLVVFVDAWTSVGGSQFVDSPGSGRYHTYLCEEVVPFVDTHYDTSGLRGVAGKSSGGYGAAVTAMLRPDLFHGFASHSGGGLFEVTIRPFFRVAARALRDRYDGSIDGFVADLRTSPAPLAHPDDIHVLLQWGFSAAYSADENGTIRLPYDTATAEVIPELWERWLEWDYPTLVPRHADALRELRAIYFDAGSRDEWYVDLTMEWMSRKLTALGVADLHVDLFDATHANVEYRYPLGLGYLAERLA
jgi:pimeloyl-ACP methyl ester carboxylesterase